MSEKETDELKEAALDLSKNAPVTDRKVFHPSNKKHYEDEYFLDSANKIGYFFEADAIDANGQLKTNETHALNKVRIYKKKENTIITLMFIDFHCTKTDWPCTAFTASNSLDFILDSNRRCDT